MIDVHIDREGLARVLRVDWSESFTDAIIGEPLPRGTVSLAVGTILVETLRARTGGSIHAFVVQQEPARSRGLYEFAAADLLRTLDVMEFVRAVERALPPDLRSVRKHAIAQIRDLMRINDITLDDLR